MDAWGCLILGLTADLKEEMVKLSDWLSELRRLYRHRISIRLIDARMQALLA